MKTNVELPGLVGGSKKIELSEGCTSGGAEARGLRCENPVMRGYEALGEREAPRCSELHAEDLQGTRRDEGEGRARRPSRVL